MQFFNNPIFSIGDYNIYPAFIILVLLIPAIIFAVFIIAKKRNQTPRERKSHAKRERFKRPQNEAIVEGTYENPYNTITTWQKKYVSDVLTEDVSNYRIEIGADSEYTDEYINMVHELRNFVVHAPYWSLADLVKIHPNSAIFLTIMLLQATAKEMYEEKNIGRVVLLANTIDRVNGGFEKTITKGQEWIDETSVAVSSNHKGNEESKRLLGTILASFDFLESMMEDGIIMNDVAFLTQELEMTTAGDISVARGDLMNAENFFKDIATSTRLLVERALLFRLQHQVDAIAKADASSTIRPNDFNYIRALACMTDNNDYQTIIDTIE